jgi:hypothetical protein
MVNPIRGPRFPPTHNLHSLKTMDRNRKAVVPAIFGHSFSIQHYSYVPCLSCSNDPSIAPSTDNIPVVLLFAHCFGLWRCHRRAERSAVVVASIEFIFGKRALSYSSTRNSHILGTCGCARHPTQISKRLF